MSYTFAVSVFFFQAEDGIRDLVRSRGLGDVYKRQEEDGAVGDRGGQGRAQDAPSRDEQQIEDDGQYQCQARVDRIVVDKAATGNLVGQHLAAAQEHDARQQGEKRQVGWQEKVRVDGLDQLAACLLYTSPSPRDRTRTRMPSSA